MRQLRILFQLYPIIPDWGSPSALLLLLRLLLCRRHWHRCHPGVCARDQGQDQGAGGGAVQGKGCSDGGRGEDQPRGKHELLANFMFRTMIAHTYVEMKYALSFCRISFEHTFSCNPRRADFKAVWFQKDEVSIRSNLECGLTVISTKGPTLRVPFLSSIPRACAGWREATSRASTRLHLEYLDQEIEECSCLYSSFDVSPCFMMEILEEFCNAALHGGDTASECRGASNPRLISSHLDFLLVLLSLSLFTSISCCPN